MTARRMGAPWEAAGRDALPIDGVMQKRVMVVTSQSESFMVDSPLGAFHHRRLGSYPQLRPSS